MENNRETNRIVITKHIHLTPLIEIILTFYFSYLGDTSLPVGSADYFVIQYDKKTSKIIYETSWGEVLS